MPVVLSQFHHAVLHDIEGGFVVSYVVDRTLEGALFDAFQKLGEFLFCCQEVFALRRSLSWLVLWHATDEIACQRADYLI